MSIPTKPFDAAKYLTAEADQLDLISDALASGNAGYIAAAIGTVARARGMSKLAEETGYSRSTLYQALGPDGNPTLETIMKVLAALGIALNARAVESA